MIKKLWLVLELELGTYLPDPPRVTYTSLATALLLFPGYLIWGYP
jgi:hypothetical protein